MFVAICGGRDWGVHPAVSRQVGSETHATEEFMYIGLGTVVLVVVVVLVILMLRRG
jgi:hypothetical protein